MLGRLHSDRFTVARMLFVCLAGLELLLKAIHALYADYVLKNPFYELDMPIKCDKFDERLTRLLHDFTR